MSHPGISSFLCHEGPICTHPIGMVYYDNMFRTQGNDVFDISVI